MNSSESNNLFVSLQTPHVFKCEINNRPLMAVIKGEYKEAEYFGYKISFSDGFKGMFVAGEDGWRSEKEAKLYLESIKRELNRFVAQQLNKFITDTLKFH
jgi:hypothetical protein